MPARARINWRWSSTDIAGDSAKAEGLAKKSEAESEKAEAKRQDKFKQDQKSLEKELGL